MDKKVENSDELLIAKVNDKIRLAKTKNKIMHTDFLNEQEVKKIQKYLVQNKIFSIIFFGGYEKSNRKALVTYPDEKLDISMVENNYDKIFSAIRIKLNSELVRKI